MTGIILTGHGEFAKGLTSTMEMLMGPQEKFEQVNFTQDSNADELKEHFVAAIQKLSDCEEIIILCDIMGGSPFKAALELTQEYKNLYIISGTNMGMIAEAVLTREFKEDIKSFVQKLVEAGQNSVIYTDVESLLDGDDDLELDEDDDL